MTKLKRPLSSAKKSMGGTMDTDRNDDGTSRTTGATGSAAVTVQSSNKKRLSTSSLSRLSFRSAVVLPAILLVVYYFYSVVQLHGGEGTVRPHTSSSSSSSSSSSRNDGTTACDYYLAESTIPNAGWGIFTYRALYQDDMINITNGESGISVVDLTTQHGNYLHTLYYNYMWNADVIGSHNEGGGRTIYTRARTRNRQQQEQDQKLLLPGNVLSLITGIGMLSNGHPLDYNIVPYQIPIPHPPRLASTTTTTTDFVISRHSKTPTTGAITYYHQLPYFAYNNHKSPQPASTNTRNMVVPAGGELIINYGTGWNTRFDFQQYRIHPPDRPKQNTHSLPYLERHGYCMDTIVSSYPFVSKIVPEAGYGGLARRAIRNNTVIIPIPTIPIHRYALHMGTRNSDAADDVDDEFDEDDSSHTQKPPSTSTTRTRQQLLLNYVLGHVHSNVLLVPYGPGIHLINHHSTQYNARLRWSTRERTKAATTSSQSDNKRRPSWVLDPEHITIQQLMEEQPGGRLVLELVAIRDIARGEEILIHYGTAWEDAYQRHQLEWEHQSLTKPKNNDDDEYVYAYTMNQQMEHQTLLRTEVEQMNAPYPSNLQLECYYVPHLYHEVSDDTNHKYMEWDSNNVHSMMHTQQMYHPNQLRPCQVLHRLEMDHEHRTGYVYHVQLMDVPYIVHNVPRHMITFRDVPYTQDQHLENVFRHEIQLPDDVFPHHWKDLL